MVKTLFFVLRGHVTKSGRLCPTKPGPGRPLVVNMNSQRSTKSTKVMFLFTAYEAATLSIHDQSIIITI